MYQQIYGHENSFECGQVPCYKSTNFSIQEEEREDVGTYSAQSFKEGSEAPVPVVPGSQSKIYWKNKKPIFELTIAGDQRWEPGRWKMVNVNDGAEFFDFNQSKDF